MPASLTLTTHRRADGSTVVRVEGEIDMGNAEVFAAALDREPSGPVPLVVDLGAVEYLDSAALSILFARADRIELVANPILRPLLAISGLSALVTVREPGAPGAEPPAGGGSQG
ncbi:STAS domain-containing protein [Kitasatospora sp. NPDC059571]|uniref:STAS domain-containing protein n=1 Tax=Kitasatospora sp. NPDC059571 TaxID=3346871 RepID=UPI0036A66109